MSDIKCPFCQQELIPCIQNQNDWIYHCDNIKCPMYDDADNENAKHLLASEDLWKELIRTRKALGTENNDLSDKIGKLETELDRIRKALDKAKDGLEYLFTYDDDVLPVFVLKHIMGVLDQIKTALEQKDK